MKIWHSGGHWSPLLVNGVNSLIYSIAREQAELGHEVTLLLCGTPDDAAVELARNSGIRLRELPSGIWQHGAAAEELLKSNVPDLVHMHSVFIPQQASLARALRRHGVSYLVTPNGGLSPRILGRGRWKKVLYTALVEKRRFRDAASISLVTPAEEAEVRSFVPQFRGLMPCIPNAVDPEPLEHATWEPTTSRLRCVYLGRFDVEHKGIDILLALATALSQADFHLYGIVDGRTEATLSGLKEHRPPNVFFHGPVFGREKARVLAEANLYIQTSRWEAFGISIAEAMYVGLPCAIASTLHIATLFQEHDLGLVVPLDPAVAAPQIARALKESSRLTAWSQRARTFAREHFHPRAVAARFLDCYQRSLAA